MKLLANMHFDNQTNQQFTPKLNDNVDVVKNQYPRQERMKSTEESSSTISLHMAGAREVLN